MIRGFYTAASGIVTQEKKLNTYANNIANVATAGFKKDNLVAGTFGEHVAISMKSYKRQQAPDQIGTGAWMQTIDEKYIDYAQGSFVQTDRALDFAVKGDGFFLVKDAEGADYLTRNGQFAIDQEGYLVLPGFGRVQGEGGDITLEGSNFVVSSKGTVYQLSTDPDEEAQEIDKLMLVTPTDYAQMDKSENGMFVSDAFSQLAEDNDTIVMQGTMERSNVDMAEEMTRIIASQRSLQSASQLVKMYDEMNTKANDQLGRLR